MDALVAERVMGWHLGSYPGVFGLWVNPKGGTRAHETQWRPSTDIEAAWQVIESFGCFFTVAKLAKEDLAEKYIATIVCGSSTKEGWADTAPLAICRVALKIVLASQPA